jgi:hypothetical protein
MPNSIIANSIMGPKIYPSDLSHKGTGCYCLFVGISAFHANIDVHDN